MHYPFTGKPYTSGVLTLQIANKPEDLQMLTACNHRLALRPQTHVLIASAHVLKPSAINQSEEWLLT